MHGGLPKVDNIMLEDIRKLDRFLEPGEGSTLTDLLWADPQDAPGRGTSKRGTSAQFGPDITAEFCKQNGLDYIIRSHEVKEKGPRIGIHCAHNQSHGSAFKGFAIYTATQF